MDRRVSIGQGEFDNWYVVLLPTSVRFIFYTSNNKLIYNSWKLWDVNIFSDYSKADSSMLCVDTMCYGNEVSCQICGFLLMFFFRMPHLSNSSVEETHLLGNRILDRCHLVRIFVGRIVFCTDHVSCLLGNNGSLWHCRIEFRPDMPQRS